MCECINWRWDIGSKYPPGVPFPNHHPNCPHYQPIRFQEFRGLGCCVIDTPRGISDILLNWDWEDDFSVTDIWLTQDQVDQMEEFTGF